MDNASINVGSSVQQLCPRIIIRDSQPKLSDFILTDSHSVLVPQHDVVWRQVSMDDPLLLVQVPKRQAQLQTANNKQRLFP